MTYWNSGTKVIWGIPLKVLPVTNCPLGAMKLRFRSKSEGRAYFRTPDGIRAFILEDKGDHWEPCIEIGRNLRKEIHAS